MNSHLTDEQLTGWLTANADPATCEHLQQCAECNQQAEQLRGLVAGFGEVMRREAAVTQPRRPLRPLAHVSSAALRWAFAGAAALLLLASGLLFSPTPPPAADPQIAAVHQDPDDVLLMEVQSDVQRDVPVALEPAALILTERNRLAAMPMSQSEGEDR